MRCFTELSAAARQLDLALCQAAERVDRTGVWKAGGAGSATAHLQHTAGQPPAWVAARLHVGRALADSLPATRQAWQDGLLGLEHARVIRSAVETPQR